jgi:hypothetical protein
MLTFREIIRIASVVIFALGIVCLPVGWPPPNPKSWTSSFSLIAHTGQFQVIGGILSLVGVLLFVASYIQIPSKK